MDNTASCMIEVCDLHKHYKDVHVLRGISTTVFDRDTLFPFSSFPGEAAVPAGAFRGPQAAGSRYQNSTRFVQFPGMALSVGMRDSEVL